MGGGASAGKGIAGGGALTGTGDVAREAKERSRAAALLPRIIRRSEKIKH
jgi:hypothetical protein